MEYIRKSISVLLLMAICCAANAQQVSIPAYTGYATPMEENNEDGESKLFTLSNGLQNWADTKQRIQFFFRVRTAGKLNLSLLVKNDVAGNKIKTSLSEIPLSNTEGSLFPPANIPQSKDFKLIRIGSVEIKDTGNYKFTIAASSKIGKTIADIKSLELSGPATKDIHFNPKPRRNSASVHLFYPSSDTMKATSFYSEITVPKDADPLYSYYMACGFARGYFGIQVNGPTERRVIFSVWDAGTEATDRDKVPDSNRVQLVAKGEEVFADAFGNEGTGGHSHWVYDWKAGETYKFLVTAVVDSAANTTVYAGYFFIPETQKWKLIACFKAPKDGQRLHKLYSFVENFEGNNGQLYRKAFFGNQWIRRETGEWKELTNSTFSYDATGRAGDRLDYGGGADSNRFYLWNGGFKMTNTHFGEAFNRQTMGVKPVVDLYKNEDSAIEFARERLRIIEAINNGKIDTTGSIDGVYYKILQEGTGPLVKVTDTLVVRYKGTLLNGAVFDETKEKPATFPLKRLIRGWQAAMPFCRQGGKIRLILPSSMAYSIRNLGTNIPPNSILIFDVEVLEIKPLSH